TAADMDRYRGKLAGKVALLDKARDLSAAAAAAETRRYTAEKLAELASFDTEAGQRGAAERQGRGERGRAREQGREVPHARRGLRDQVRRSLHAEQALASIEASPRSWDLIQVQGGGPHRQGEPPVVIGLVMAAEPYNRLLRLLDAGEKVELAIDVQARYHDDD